MSAAWQKGLLVRCVPPLAAVLIRLLGATLRYRVIVEPGAFAAKKDERGGVYCFWHRCLIPAAYFYRGWKIAILISRSKDGELIARTVDRLGFFSIRGSSSRDGAQGLIAAREAYERGYHAAFTADGPRGPVYVAKPGAVMLAAMAGAGWVGSAYLHPERAWQLKTWDRFLVPKPFSRVCIAFARVVEVSPNVTDRDYIDAKTAELTATMERTRHAAERGSW